MKYDFCFRDEAGRRTLEVERAVDPRSYCKLSEISLESLNNESRIGCSGPQIGLTPQQFLVGKQAVSLSSSRLNNWSIITMQL